MSTPLVVALVLASLALLFAVGSFVLTLFRRQSQLARNLYAENDLKDERIVRLEKELAAALDSLHAAQVKISPELLARYAEEGVDYAEQAARLQEAGGARPLTPAEKFEHAWRASMKRDAGDNGRRDWTDAEHRIAIEAVLARRRREEASNSKPAKA